jgi:hypothetical protein
MDRRQLLRATSALGAAGALAATATTAHASASRSAVSDPTRPLRVHVVMVDGVEELDFAAPYEVLSAAGFFTPRPMEVRYVSATGARSVTGAYGTVVRGIRPWAPEEADLLVVPGSGYARRDSPGVWAEIDGGTLPRALADAPRPGQLLVGAQEHLQQVAAAHDAHQHAEAVHDGQTLHSLARHDAGGLGERGIGMDGDGRS